MRIKKMLALALTIFVIAGGCSDDDDGNNNNNNPNCFVAPDAPTLASNSPVPSGQALHLSAVADGNAVYRWVAPDGEEYIEQDQIITFTGPTDAGDYECYVIVDGCTSSVATITVVVEPPVVPCTPADNTTDYADPLPDVTYNQVTANPDPVDSLYMINADGDHGDLDITFAFPKAPNQGLYRIVPSTTPVDSLQPDDVRVTCGTGGIVPCSYGANAGDLYVTYTSGAVTVTYCGITFTSAGGCGDVVATGRVVVQ